MGTRQSWLVVSISGLALFAPALGAPATGGAELRFEPNLGQTDARYAFLSRGRGYAVFLTPGEAVFRLSVPSTGADQPARLRFLGANPLASLAGEDAFSGRSHYFLGSEPSRWIPGVANYRRVVATGIYPGIDLVYYSRDGHLSFDLLVRPGARPEDVILEIDGGELALDAFGDLVLSTPAGELRIGRPTVFQETGQGREPVTARYRLERGSRVRFQLAPHDASRPLWIDPRIRFSTFLGGSGGDYALAVAVDSEGAAYVTGSTESVDFPATGLERTAPGAPDTFVVKLAPGGTEIAYSTFLGGTGVDWGAGVAVDGAGSAYITGTTSSTDFPTRNPLQASSGGEYDAFVVKLNPTGSALEFSTYLGGSAFDSARGAALDSALNLVTMGQTSSPDFPTRNARQPRHAGAVDAFVAKLDASGGKLVFSTFHGGSGNDLPFYSQGVGSCGGPVDAPGWGVAVDPFGFIYVAGTTESLDFPIVNAFQSAHRGGLRDAFASKLAPDGSALVYSTWIGGTGGDSARGLAVDRAGNAYLTGATRSFDFPISSGAVQRTKSLDYDAFLVKLGTTGGLLYSTYLGGNGGDAGNAIAVDPGGNAIAIGHTGSTNFPLSNPLGPTSPGGANLFAAKANAAASALLYSTYLGGSGDETPCGLNMGIAADSIGNAYVAAATASGDFPVTSGAPQNGLAGGFDAFVTLLRTEPEIRLELRPEGAQTRMRVTLGNPAPTMRKLELKFWVDSPFLELPLSVVPVQSVLSLPHMPPTTVIDSLLPSGLRFPGTTIGVRLIDPATGEELDESVCSDSPCN